MTLEQAIDRYSNNAEYERRNGSLQGCMEFRQLAEWLKDYKRLLEQEPVTTTNNNEPITVIYPTIVCEDAISRKTVLDIDFRRIILTTAKPAETIEQKVKALPPVTPQPKTGRWVKNDWTPICSCCGKYKYEDIDGSIYDDVWFPNYCPNCGARMVESQESEGKE